jgi:hypothetical protein
MNLPQRDWIVLLGISVAFCVAWLVEPDWNLKEAHRVCAGQPVQVFESMTACTVNQPPGCPCVRPQNPWVIAYWLVFLVGVGVAAAFLLRSHSLLGAAFLAGAMVVGGYLGIFILSRRKTFEPEAWAFAPYAFAITITITLVAFGLARRIRHLVVKRQPAT